MMGILSGRSLGLSILAGIHSALSFSIPAPDSPIFQTSSNTSLSIPPAGADTKYLLKGSFGKDDLPSVSALMVAVEGMADLAHLDSDRKIKGFHVATPPQYSAVDINIQPVAPSTEVQVQHAAFGLYCVIYQMVTTKTFKNSVFRTSQNGVYLVQIQISKRSRPPLPPAPELADISSPGIQNVSQSDAVHLNASVGDAEFEHHFEFVDTPAQAMLPQDVFITVLATLRNMMLVPDQEMAKPCRSGAVGFNVRIDFLGLEVPPTNEPILRVGHFIDAIKKIPEWMVQQKKFGAILIILSFGNEIIGEAVLEKGSPTEKVDLTSTGSVISSE